MGYESEDKQVAHPTHYQSKKGLEVIDIIDAFTEELNGVEAFDTSNIIKYACRWKHKNGVQDLKKIMWYCQHLIDHLEQKQRDKYHAQNMEELKVAALNQSPGSVICGDENKLVLSNEFGKDVGEFNSKAGIHVKRRNNNK